MIRSLTCAVFAGIVVLSQATGSASAATPVDPGSLQPQPPDGATCVADGAWTICDVTLTEKIANEPVFEAPCGTVYETSTATVDSRRWYLDGLLVKRHRRDVGVGVKTLSPTNEGPSVEFVYRLSVWTHYGVPGDVTSGVTTEAGSYVMHIPGAPGRTVHIAGLDLPDGRHLGVFRPPEDESAAAMLCAALGG